MLRALALLAVLALGTSTAHAAIGKCLHCSALAAELQKRLDAEVPRNHLDMRHRLDSEGKRYGKVIEYKVSELRAVELLDELCNAMGHYELAYVLANETDTCTGHCSKGWNWVRKGSGVKSRYDVSRQELKSRQKDLESYCSRVLEGHEDDLTRDIMAGVFEDKDVQTHLCEDVLRVCKGEVPVTAADGEEEEEAEGGREEL